MRTKQTCVITKSGRRVCGRPTVRASGAAPVKSLTRYAVEDASAAMADEADRLEDQYRNFGISVSHSEGAADATLRIEYGNQRAEVRFIARGDRPWKLTYDERFSGNTYKSDCHYEESFLSAAAAFKETRARLGLR